MVKHPMNNIMSNEEIWKAIGNTPYDDSVGVLQQLSEVSFPPDFHNSLDACFTWIVPWLDDNGWSIWIKKSKRYYIAFQNIKLNNAKPFAFDDKSLSIAFVKAFSQMANKDGG